jgi:UDP-N-acetylglucosamine--N-acetylmuramyl-(pentapeptide) pyrophosphoryl-undecaprenol N-acetylglucosamine transferase
MTGPADESAAQRRRAGLSEEQQARYRPRAYIDDMPAAMRAADLVISRAGASVLGELPAAGVASILVPGEYEGWSQAPNAEFLQERGAAVMLRNAELTKLADLAVSLLEDDLRLRRMADAARALARPDAARDVALMLIEEAA